MCGFIFWINYKNKVDPLKLENAINLQNHRGPDNKNIIFFDDKKKLFQNQKNIKKKFRIGIAHTRLSILDLTEKSNQPMVSKDTNYSLVYNGEIYNYLELRNELIKEGNFFQSKGDTEVLFQILIKKEINFLKKINGMWSFIFYNKKRNQLILSCDKYGKKPLFYYKDNENFVASSTIKSIFEIIGIKRSVNMDVLSAFLISKRCPILKNGETFYKKIFSLKQGENLQVDLQKNKLSKIFNDNIDEYINKDFNKKDILNDINSSINLRLRSDVPIGVALSSGVDSSTIAGNIVSMKKNNNVNFFTVNTTKDDMRGIIDLEKDLKIDIHKSIINENEFNFLKIFSEIVSHFETPTNLRLLALPQYFIFKEMKKQGIKVVIDGTGGDEIFGGYPQFISRVIRTLFYKKKFFSALYLSSLNYPIKNTFSTQFQYMKSIFKDAFRPLIKRKTINQKLIMIDIFKKFTKKNLFLFDDYLEKFLNVYFFDTLKEMQLNSLKIGTMRDYLISNDRMSMMYSMEVRSPFLDYRLLKYLNLRDKYKFNRGFNKFLIRKLMSNKINEKIRWQKKSGFSFANQINFFLKNKEEKIFNEIRASSFLSKIFNINDLLKNYSKNRKNEDIKQVLWLLLIISLIDKKFNLEI